MFIFLSFILSEHIRINFAANTDKFLALDYKDLLDNTFVATSHKWLITLPNLCGVPSKRHIHEEFSEFYFCGLKMCVDEEVGHLTTCEENEKETKWGVLEVDENRYHIKNGDSCITLMGEASVGLQPCNKLNVNQRVIFVPYYDNEYRHFKKEDKNSFAYQMNAELERDEQWHRVESLFQR